MEKNGGKFGHSYGGVDPFDTTLYPTVKDWRKALKKQLAAHRAVLLRCHPVYQGKGYPPAGGGPAGKPRPVTKKILPLTLDVCRAGGEGGRL